MVASTPPHQDNQPDHSPQMGSESAAWEAQLEFVRGLALVVQREGLSDLEVEHEGVRITLKAGVAVAQSSTATPATTATLPLRAPAAERPSAADLTPIVAPMVGVFYRAQSPDDPPFVEIGDHVEVGQAIGLVEAMKTFNEILSEVEGVVAEIRARNGDLVEAGSPLILVRKA